MKERGQSKNKGLRNLIKDMQKGDNVEPNVKYEISKEPNPKKDRR